MIAQSAKNRYDLAVQAVYWRFYEAVSTGTAGAGVSNTAAPLFGMGSHTNSRPAPLSEVPYPVVTVAACLPRSPYRSTRPPNPCRPQLLQLQREPHRLPDRSSRKVRAQLRKPGPDPLEQDEVDAFKRALASGAQPDGAKPLSAAPASANAFATTQAYASPHVAANTPALAAAVVAKTASLAAINNKLLLTGYEDTEMPDPDAPVLSNTQYGELR